MKLFVITFAAGILLAQGPVTTSETMTPAEAQSMAAITARIAGAQQALNSAQAAMKNARAAQSDTTKRVIEAHGHTGYGPWKLQPDGSLIRSYHVVEIRGTLLIHTQDNADVCPAENVKSSGANYFCLAGK